MGAAYKALLIFLACYLTYGQSTKRSFAFKKVVGDDTLRIVDFHVMKGQIVKDAAIYEADQGLVSNWFECYTKCLGLAKDCRSFNFKRIGSVITCQPTGVMPHLQSAKLDAAGSYEVWYMPYPDGTATIA